MQAERTAIEEARQQFEAEKAEAAAFADQLSQELEAAKTKVSELASAIDVAGEKITALQTGRDQETARAERLQQLLMSARR